MCDVESSAVAKNVNGVVITSSLEVKSKDHKGAIKALVPLLTAIQSFRLKVSLI